MTQFESMRKRLLQRAGVIEKDPAPYQGMKYDDIRAQECDDQFAELMDNRLVMGFLRYGPIAKSKPLFYDIKKARERIDLYEKSGNLEHLVDAGNFCRLEFRRSAHPNKHFHAEDRA